MTWWQSLLGNVPEFTGPWRYDRGTCLWTREWVVRQNHRLWHPSSDGAIRLRPSRTYALFVDGYGPTVMAWWKAIS